MCLGDYHDAEKRLLMARNRCPKEEFETISLELLKVGMRINIELWNMKLYIQKQQQIVSVV